MRAVQHEWEVVSRSGKSIDGRRRARRAWLHWKRLIICWNLPANLPLLLVHAKLRRSLSLPSPSFHIFPDLLDGTLPPRALGGDHDTVGGRGRYRYPTGDEFPSAAVDLTHYRWLMCGID